MEVRHGSYTVGHGGAISADNIVIGEQLDMFGGDIQSCVVMNHGYEVIATRSLVTDGHYRTEIEINEIQIMGNEKLIYEGLVSRSVCCSADRTEKLIFYVAAKDKLAAMGEVVFIMSDLLYNQ